MRYSCIFCLVLLALCIGRLDRFFFKSNDSFSIGFIHAPIPPNAQWDASLPFPQEAFSQPFHYLAKGSQSFVFVSQDQQYVLKFYRFPSHMRRTSWKKFAYLFDQKRQAVKTYNEKKFALSFSSYRLAAEHLSSETAILYLHLNPTNNLGAHVQLIDKLGHAYLVSLDNTFFVLQRKAESFFSVFEKAMQNGDLEQGKHMINELIALIAHRCQKNITDLDCMARDNYGWLEGHAIHLDIGRFAPDTTIDTKTEVLRITQVFSDNLANNYPALKLYFNQKIASL